MSKTYTWKRLYIYVETEKAICVSVEKTDSRDEQFWLPKSQIEYEEGWQRGDAIEVKIPDWLVEQHDL